MNLALLARRSFAHYASANAASIAGVAIAVAVLTGALLVGDAVRGSLRDLAEARVGRVGSVLSGASYFREALGAEMQGVPVIVLTAVVTRQDDRRRAGNVTVYGVDERFWQLHGVGDRTPGDRELHLSPGLAEELQAQGGEALLLRVERPSSIPRESLHGRKEDAGKVLRLRAGAVLSRREMGEFALVPSQGAVRAAFVSLPRLQRELDMRGRANTLLFAAGSQPDLGKMRLDDLGVKLVPFPGGLSMESHAAILNDGLAEAARKVAPDARTVFTYLVNGIRSNGREVPYSVVTGAPEVKPGEIQLNDWTARDLGVKLGDAIELEYYFWDEAGALLTRRAPFRLSAVMPTKDDRTLAPEYPGITESTSLSEWDPPFPMDLKRVRPKDEEYWKQYRATPKGFVSLEDAARLWGSRFGHATAVRTADTAVAAKWRAALDPQRAGVAVADIRANAVGASSGSTDFGGYFLAFSFFLMVSALLLTSLFFQLGVEQRLREIGLLRATGFAAPVVERLFLREGTLLALVGTGLGVALGGVYSAFILYGLRTWWRGAVGTSDLTWHATPASLVGGALGGLVCAVATLWWSLRGLRQASPRDLLAGRRQAEFTAFQAQWPWLPGILLGGAVTLLGLGAAKLMPAAGAFFGGGFLLLAGAIWWFWNRLRRPRASHTASVTQLGVRNAAWRPGRSALGTTLIAVAVFLLVSLEAFRQGDALDGAGGFTMVAESQLPVVYDLNSPEGQDAMGLRGAVAGVKFAAFRLKPGDDASCLNLYEPRNPRVLGARPEFRALQRFGVDWTLLERTEPDGSVPAIADANSMQYILKKQVGDVLTLPSGARLKLVAAMKGSMLQSELIISDRQFQRLFPEEQGYRFFLLEGPETAGVALEDRLSDFGFDVTTARERLAAYHAVENTYLSTFQALGALGLLLGTAGLAALLMRHVLERRRELGLLRAVGYRLEDLTRLVLTENLVLAGMGLLVGTGCACIAILPAALERGRQLPWLGMLALLALVGVVAMASSWWGVRLMRRLPLLESLRHDG